VFNPVENHHGWLVSSSWCCGFTQDEDLGDTKRLKWTKRLRKKDLRARHNLFMELKAHILPDMATIKDTPGAVQGVG
jgi:hypothetical protein